MQVLEHYKGLIFLTFAHGLSCVIGGKNRV